MNFSRPVTDIIQERISHRTYTGHPLEKNLRDKIVSLLENYELKSPFSEYAGKARFKLLSIPEFDPKEKKKIGTYGFIKGAQDFIVGAVEKSQYDREHYGYLLETIILSATDLGLGTCWIGGYFNRSLFSRKINCTSHEILPAITPVGFTAPKRVKEKIIRSFAKADKRFPWDTLFFEGNLSNPLSKIKTEEYSKLLEMVRLGPSAGNKQPWRIIKMPDENVYHFYSINPKDGRFLKYSRFRPLDIGIAVCHFDLTAKELDIKGTWIFEKPQIFGTDDLEYKISWKGDK
ncbi:MAG: nitroreductase family protein [Promethearchaeota archaeon]|jgi:nitroreductase